jgi:hypothetical protein
MPSSVDLGWRHHPVGILFKETFKILYSGFIFLHFTYFSFFVDKKTTQTERKRCIVPLNEQLLLRITVHVEDKRCAIVLLVPVRGLSIIGLRNPSYRTIDNRNQVKTIDAYRLRGRHHPMGKNSVAAQWHLLEKFGDTLIYELIFLYFKYFS